MEDHDRYKDTKLLTFTGVLLQRKKNKTKHQTKKERKTKQGEYKIPLLCQLKHL